MRRMLQGRAGVGLAFMLGLVIATAATATAAKLITGSQIKDGSISSKDLSRTVRAQLRKAGVRGLPGVQGAQGLQGAKGDLGPSGTSRAYGSVTAPGVLVPGHSKNVVKVVHTPATGIYCIWLDKSIDADTAVAVASTDWSFSSTSGSLVAVVEVIGGSSCGPTANGIMVKTFEMAAVAASFTVSASDEGFALIVG